MKKKKKIHKKKLLDTSCEHIIFQRVPTVHKVLKKSKRIFLIEFLMFPFIVVNVLIFVGCVILLDAINQTELPNSVLSSSNSVIVPSLPEKIRTDINARAFIIYDPESRVVIDGRNEYLQFAPASATKIMTALVALDHYQLSDVLVSRNISKVSGSKMGLIEGEAMTLENLLYGLMLPSGNDAAYVIAHSYPGGEKQFVQDMNKKARKLSLVNTQFVDAAGLYDENFTTAFDLARLASYAARNPILSEIIKTRYKVVYNTAKTSQYELTNLNQLLADSNVVGVKTGFTDEAGGVLVTAYKNPVRTYVIVVLKSPDRFYDTQQIMYGIIPQIELVTYSARSNR